MPTVLIVPFVVQVLVAIGLVGYLSFRSGQSAVNALVSQLVAPQENLADKPYDSVKNYRPTIRPWYKTAKEANRPTWTKIYQTASDSLDPRLETTNIPENIGIVLMLYHN
jgi:hypothetical protein